MAVGPAAGNNIEALTESAVTAVDPGPMPGRRLVTAGVRTNRCGIAASRPEASLDRGDGPPLAGV